MSDSGQQWANSMAQEVREAQAANYERFYRDHIDCNWCGKPFTKGERYCDNCRAPISEVEPTPEEGHPFPHNHTGRYGTP